MDDDSLASALAEFLTRRCGSSVRVSAIRQLAGGASCRLFAFDLDDGSSTRTLVLRLDSDGGPARSDRREEFALLSAAARAGVTVPAVHWSGDAGEGLGGAFFIMDEVAGEAIARRLLRDARYENTRRALPRHLAREAAHTHRIDVADEGIGFLRGREPGGNDPRRYALAEIDKYRQILGAFADDHPYPLLLLTARWLEQHAPAVQSPALVHGDFRIGNVMFNENGLTAVLDWELAHIGDPVEDLGWLCVRTWRFGSDALAAGGLCSREDLLRFYREEGGAEVDAEHLKYWELFGNWKWAIICRMQAERHKAGRRPDVELATIGRRVAETEDELLALGALGAGGEAGSDSPGSELGGTELAQGHVPEHVHARPRQTADQAAARQGLRDKPGGTELLEALGVFLDDISARLEGSARFKAIVGANVVGIVAREIALSPAHDRAQALRLAALLRRHDAITPSCDHGAVARQLSFELCRRIQAGDADTGPWRADVLAHLRATVDEKLAIDNPGRLGRSQRGA
ncbi:MAG TPA: phosphotransferase family protein [Candidatus Binatia bacterium]|nr:phosphotransferase family protein [Candidatus Binatia bacterium]